MGRLHRPVAAVSAIVTLALAATGCSTSPGPDFSGTYLAITGNEGLRDLETLEANPIEVKIRKSSDHFELSTDICGPFEATLGVISKEILSAEVTAAQPEDECPADEAALREWLSTLLSGEVEWLLR